MVPPSRRGHRDPGTRLVARGLAAALALAVCAGCARVAPPVGGLRWGSPPGLEVRCFPVQVGEPGGRFTENCYLLFDPTRDEALLVDPGGGSRPLERFVAGRALKVVGILNTHGHDDHTGANRTYSRRYGVPVYAHLAERPFYEGARYPIRFLEREGPVSIAGFEVVLLHTPGHSPGSVAYLVDDVLFSGDTLFAGGIGRTWGETEEEILRLEEMEKAGIRHKLFRLPDETRVYPGHGGETTLGAERRDNPYVRDTPPAAACRTGGGPAPPMGLQADAGGRRTR